MKFLILVLILCILSSASCGSGDHSNVGPGQKSNGDKSRFRCDAAICDKVRESFFNLKSISVVPVIGHLFLTKKGGLGPTEMQQKVCNSYRKSLLKVVEIEELWRGKDVESFECRSVKGEPNSRLLHIEDFNPSFASIKLSKYLKENCENR